MYLLVSIIPIVHAFLHFSSSQLNDCINGYTHGPVHIMIGGAWNEGDVFDSNTVGFVRNPDKLLFFKVCFEHIVIVP